MKYLTAKQLLLIHDLTIEQSGGRHGIRDHRAIKALENLPKQRFYRSVFDKAALYARNVITGHPFTDGNKRTGMIAAGVFLSRNNYRITAKPGKIKTQALHIARHNPDLESIATWFRKNSTKN